MFTDRQIGMLQTFADQAVIAIENTRLFEALQGRIQELARSVERLRSLPRHAGTIDVPGAAITQLHGINNVGLIVRTFWPTNPASGLHA